MAALDDRGDNKVRQGELVTGPGELASEIRSAAPVVPGRLDNVRHAQPGSNPIRLILAPEAEKDFRNNGPDQRDAVGVEQLSNAGLVRGSRSVEECPPNAGIDKDPVVHGVYSSLRGGDSASSRSSSCCQFSSKSTLPLALFNSRRRVRRTYSRAAARTAAASLSRFVSCFKAAISCGDISMMMLIGGLRRRCAILPHGMHRSEEHTSELQSHSFIS